MKRRRDGKSHDPVWIFGNLYRSLGEMEGDLNPYIHEKTVPGCAGRSDPRRTRLCHCLSHHSRRRHRRVPYFRALGAPQLGAAPGEGAVLEQLKNSLNAFLFQDKTMYPACSRDQEDWHDKLELVRTLLDTVLSAYDWALEERVFYGT